MTKNVCSYIIVRKEIRDSVFGDKAKEVDGVENEIIDTGDPANIEEQLKKIIEENDSLWDIALKSFELGKAHLKTL